jgi:hypothetical protein
MPQIATGTQRLTEQQKKKKSKEKTRLNLPIATRRCEIEDCRRTVLLVEVRSKEKSMNSRGRACPRYGS